MERLEKFMREKVDSDKIDREGKIPPEIIEELRQMGRSVSRSARNTVAWG